MNDAAIRQWLQQRFGEHGVELEPDEEWLITDGDFPAVRAVWREGAAGVPGRLDVEVVLDEERGIEESFAGRGAGEAACRDALDAFERSTLHVLLAACWYATDDRRLRLETWENGLRSWDAFIGPWHLRGDAPSATLPAAEAVAAVAAALAREPLAPRLHWLRLFCRRGADGAVDVEALLDNQPWPAGDQALAAQPWPAGDYAARCFVALDLRDY